jgi:hypothetical protein
MAISNCLFTLTCENPRGFYMSEAQEKLSDRCYSYPNSKDVIPNTFSNAISGGVPKYMRAHS